MTGIIEPNTLGRKLSKEEFLKNTFETITKVVDSFYDKGFEAYMTSSRLEASIYDTDFILKQNKDITKPSHFQYQTNIYFYPKHDNLIPTGFTAGESGPERA